MKWNYKELKYREDWEEAFKSITLPQQAKAFMQAAKAVYGEEHEKLVGYMTGEIEGFENAKAKRELLGVKHPLNPEDKQQSSRELMELGFNFARNTPNWLQIAMAIPRRQLVHPLEGGVVKFPANGIPRADA